jgi:hypothetical protein
MLSGPPPWAMAKSHCAPTASTPATRFAAAIQASNDATLFSASAGDSGGSGAASGLLKKRMTGEN